MRAKVTPAPSMTRGPDASIRVNAWSWARTTVDIYDNAGPAFAFSTGLGVPNLSAWMHAEANAVTGHHDNWDMGCAVLLSGHENDCIYDITPGNIPGSLTMYWQHP